MASHLTNLTAVWVLSYVFRSVVSARAAVRLRLAELVCSVAPVGGVDAAKEDAQGKGEEGVVETHRIRSAGS